MYFNFELGSERVSPNFELVFQAPSVEEKNKKNTPKRKFQWTDAMRCDLGQFQACASAPNVNWLDLDKP